MVKAFILFFEKFFGILKGDLTPQLYIDILADRLYFLHKAIMFPLSGTTFYCLGRFLDPNRLWVEPQ